MKRVGREALDAVLPAGSRRRARVRTFAAARGLGRLYYEPPEVPEHLRRNFHDLSEQDSRELESKIRSHFFATLDQNFGFGDLDDYPSSAAAESDVATHLTGRLHGDRETVIPWLDALQRLRGSRILEVGCGTGASTHALAEQGAAVEAIDVDENSLEVARVRMSLAKCSTPTTFTLANAADLGTRVPGEYDFVIFFACLEHMTVDERLAALHAGFEAVRPGGHLVVLETPNRLWWFDGHTSFLPFFNWLPDSLAQHYAVRSPRSPFNQRFGTPREGAALELARWGRGASYHEFVVALDIPEQELPVVSCLEEYLDHPRWGERQRDGRFMRSLREGAPAVPAAFFYSELNLAVRRPGRG